MLHNFDKKIHVRKWEVGVDTSAGYGYFEHDTRGETGGLFFERGELYDYDGIRELPPEVLDGVRALGFRIGPDVE